MVRVLTASVGPKQPNKPNDVKTIQILLNQCIALLIPLRRLTEDGVHSQLLDASVKLFQTRVLKMTFPDSIVAPQGITWGQLTVIGEKILPANVTNFLSSKLPVAKTVKLKWRVPISVLIAQAALESGWGSSVVNNAYFGIKGRSATGASTKFTTSEYVKGVKVTLTDGFRAYKDFAEAADDYGRFLNENPRYASCFLYSNNPLNFAAQVARAGYATDPFYGDKIKSIILSNGLLRYDA